MVVIISYHQVICGKDDKKMHFYKLLIYLFYKLILFSKIKGSPLKSSGTMEHAHWPLGLVGREQSSHQAAGLNFSCAHRCLGQSRASGSSPKPVMATALWMVNMGREEAPSGGSMGTYSRSLPARPSFPRAHCYGICTNTNLLAWASGQELPATRQ